MELANKLAQVAPVSKGGRGNESGVNKASRDLNIERTEVQRAVKIAALTPEAKAVAAERGQLTATLQCGFEQAPDCLRPAWEIFLLLAPGIQCGEAGGLKADAYQSAKSRRRSPAPIFCYRFLLPGHMIYDNK